MLNTKGGHNIQFRICQKFIFKFFIIQYNKARMYIKPISPKFWNNAGIALRVFVSLIASRLHFHVLVPTYGYVMHTQYRVLVSEIAGAGSSSCVHCKKTDVQDKLSPAN